MKHLTFHAASAYRHLRAADPVVGALIEEHGPFLPRPSADPYGQLVRSVLFQQLAGAAASAIQRRLYAIFGEETRTPLPDELLSLDDDQYRAAGVSRQKAGYLRSIAEHVSDGSLDFDSLEALDDEAVIEGLTAIRGVGEWTAHMFLMFQLGRPDILPVGDLGVRNGMQVAYGLDESPAPARATEIGAPWAPYRTVGSWYMWRAAETVTPD